MSLTDRLRSAGFGRLAYRLWYWPMELFDEVVAADGLWEMGRDELGRREMEKAAYTLPLLPAPDPSLPLELHLLTGKRFWYQTVFCLWTFARQSGRALAPVIYDDGTLTAKHCGPLKRLFPLARILNQEEILSKLDDILPTIRFPTLRERWQNYPNIRKLTDVHVGQSGWKLVIDSDLLFFRRPDFIIDWLNQPTTPLHAVDCETSYGYPLELMSELAGKPLADLVNVGLTGLNGALLDWEKLEYWCRTLIERHGTHYYLEQALIAMLVAGQDCAIAPSADYVTKPDENESHSCHAAMHHYVAGSKRFYFRYCWREAMEKAEGLS